MKTVGFKTIDNEWFCCRFMKEANGMKRIALILALCLALTPACLAEQSAGEEFLENLSKTWGSFLKMGEEASQNVSKWADENGVTAWAEGIGKDIAAWADENGITAWAENATKELNTLFEESGIAAWTEETRKAMDAYIQENGPAIEAWLQTAGDEVASAWDTLVNADKHTEKEVEAAYETVTESLEEIADAEADEAGK